MFNFGIALIFLGVLSFLLPLVGLQLKGLQIFGQYQTMIAIGAIVLGALLAGIAKMTSSGKAS